MLVTIDSEKVNAFVGGLDEWVESVRNQRKSVHSVTMNQWATPPVPGTETYLSEASQIELSSVNLNEIAKGLKDRLEFTVQKNSDGKCTYYLPEDVEDTPENVKKFNVDAKDKAEKNCVELTEATSSKDGKSERTGRSVDEIMEDMKASEDNPIYADSFISYCGGPEEYLKFYNTNKNLIVSKTGKDSVTPRFSRMLATATQDEGRGRELAQQFGELVKRKDHEQDTRIGALNRLFRCEDADEGKGPIKYGTTFLTDFGEIIEECPLPEERSLENPDDIPAAHDPISGYMCALARNPEASAKFLAPTDESGNINEEAGRSRWIRLKSRAYNRDGTTNFEFTDVMRSASTLRNDPTVGAQSTWASARAIEFTANPDNSQIIEHHPERQRNLSVVLANCRKEIHEIAGGADDGDLKLNAMHGGENGSDTMKAALYRVMEDEDAARTISAAVTSYGKDEVKGDMPDGSFSLEGIKLKYANMAKDNAFLNKIAQQRIDEINAELSKKNNDENTAKLEQAKTSANAITSAFFIVASAAATVASGGNVPLGFTVGAGVTEVITQAKVNEYVESAYKGSSKEEKRKLYQGNYKDTDINNRIQTAAYIDAVKSGAIPGVEFPEGNGEAVKYEYLDENGKKKTDYWVKKDENGNNRVDLPPVVTDNLSESVHRWRMTNTGEDNSGRKVSPTVLRGFNDIDVSISGGVVTGRENSGVEKHNDELDVVNITKRRVEKTP
jgi:hypothetical protein